MDNQQKRRIGIMGGTFDPIHYGHLYIAECARYEFNLESVLFIPAGEPVHKKRKDIIDAVHRLEMTRLAVHSNPFFSVSDIEVKRSGPTYTVDTLEYLHKENGEAAEFFFITGADAIIEILTWKDVARVFELCHFIAVTRPGYSLEKMNEVLNCLDPCFQRKIHIHETSGIMVSSTEIRQSAAKGEPVRYLLPSEVEEYIVTHALYKVESGEWRVKSGE
jgi:nicotinate-nucleotide adenylyltransferase